MSDIVQLLRELAECKHSDLSVASDGADEIEALRAEVKRLRAALWDIHAVCNNWDWFIWMWPIRRIKRLARAALEEKQ